MPLPGGQGPLADLVRVLRRVVAVLPNAPASRLFMRFEVTRQGLVSQPQLVKSLRADLAPAVLQAVGQLPRFVPGGHNGRPIPV